MSNLQMRASKLLTVIRVDHQRKFFDSSAMLEEPHKKGWLLPPTKAQQLQLASRLMNGLHTIANSKHVCTLTCRQVLP